MIKYIIYHIYICYSFGKPDQIHYSAHALRALGLLLADSALTVGRGKAFWRIKQVFFTSHNSNWHFWPNIGIFGPFDPMPDQKINAEKLSWWFSVMWVSKFCLLT